MKKNKLFILVLLVLGIICIGITHAGGIGSSYDDVLFEYESSADLSEAISSLTSVPVVHLSVTGEHTLNLAEYLSNVTHIQNKTFNDSDNSVSTSDVWLYTASGVNTLSDGTFASTLHYNHKWVAVFYLTENGEIELFGHVDFSSSDNEIVGIITNIDTFSLTTGNLFGNQKLSTSFDDIKIKWGLDGPWGEFDSLGGSLEVAEPDEVRLGFVDMGTESVTQFSASGLFLQITAYYGDHDQVLVES